MGKARAHGCGELSVGPAPDQGVVVAKLVIGRDPDDIRPHHELVSDVADLVRIDPLRQLPAVPGAVAGVEVRDLRLQLHRRRPGTPLPSLNTPARRTYREHDTARRRISKGVLVV